MPKHKNPKLKTLGGAVAQRGNVTSPMPGHEQMLTTSHSPIDTAAAAGPGPGTSAMTTAANMAKWNTQQSREWAMSHQNDPAVADIELKSLHSGKEKAGHPDVEHATDVNIESGGSSAEQQVPKPSILKRAAGMVLNGVEQFGESVAAAFGLSSTQLTWYKNCWTQPGSTRDQLGFLEPSPGMS